MGRFFCDWIGSDLMLGVVFSSDGIRESDRSEVLSFTKIQCRF